MNTTDDTGGGPWPHPVDFDPDDTGTPVETRHFYQWRDLWRVTSDTARGRLVALRNAGRATNDGRIWTVKGGRW